MAVGRVDAFVAGTDGAVDYGSAGLAWRGTHESKRGSGSSSTGHSTPVDGIMVTSRSSAPNCAQPGPTGLALLALANANVSSPAVDRGLAYLSEAARDLRAPSLGWATLGLRAHQALPRAADTWLAHAYSRCIDKPDAVMGLALACSRHPNRR